MIKNNNLKKMSILTIFYCFIVLIIYPKYYFLIWNIFLAYIPFYLSFKYKNLKNKIIKAINLFLGIIFFPNAIYLFTDLIHIQNMKFYTRNLRNVEYIMKIEAWIKLSLIFIAVLIALKLSYLTIKNYSNISKTIYYKHLIYVFMSFLTGIAVFVGRFVRLNSWDLITHPITTFITIIRQLRVENLSFIILFALIQYFVIILEDNNFFNEKNML